jgi:N-methylhydantoinase B
VALRHIIGHLLPDTVIGALAQIIPDRVIAEGASALANLQLRGGASVAGDYDGEVVEFEMMHFNNGGTGARPTKDGLSATGFPNGVRGVPVEATEAIAPVVFWRKELRDDSGGAGRFRGGLGQVMELEGTDGMPFDVLAQYDKAENPARGRDGGGSGAATRLELKSGTRLRTKGQQSVPSGDRLILSLAGGGGFGHPFARDPALVAADVAGGYVSVENAADLYGVVVDEFGNLDEPATAELRG